MVKATLTTYEGAIEQKTFQNMEELTEHLRKNHGKYEAVDARVRRAKDIRQGREDRTVTRL